MKRPAVATLLSVCLLTALTACANTMTGRLVENFLAADPQLQDNSDPVSPEENTSVDDRPPTDRPVEVSPPPQPNDSENRDVTPRLPEPTQPTVDSADSNINPSDSQPSDSEEIAAETETPALDDSQIPQPLRRYVRDLIALEILSLQPTGDRADKNTISELELNKIISRREYARWLLTANNRIYAHDPSKQIRLASNSATPAFQDVLPSDPDFPIIQGLAEAGILPSRLTGDSTVVLFRPEAPLTRERLILWKVPLDTRRALPAATIEAVRETWGFQDASAIDPKPLQAVLADFQNGENANIRRSFGYTTLFMPKKTVSRAEAAAAIWYFGYQGDGISAEEAKNLSNTKSGSATS